jgi:hypothetical protein
MRIKIIVRSESYRGREHASDGILRPSDSAGPILEDRTAATSALVRVEGDYRVT